MPMVKEKLEPFSGEDVWIYSVGVCHVSVCAASHLSKADIEYDVNCQWPTGIDSDWKISEDPTFRTGEKNGCECNESPPGARYHWLLVC